MSDTSLNEEEIARNQWSRYERARDYGHLEYVRIAKQCDNFYLGHQWTEEDLQKLEDQKRPALTLNLSMPLINTIVGEFMLRQPQVHVKPTLTGNTTTADTLDKLFRVIFTDQSYNTKEEAVITDALIQDRGFFDLRLNFTTRQPTIELSVEDPLDILLDIGAKEYDPNTWTEVFKTKWVSLDEIEVQYGEKKRDKLQDLADSRDYLSQDSIELYENRFGEAAVTEGDTDTPEDRANIKKIRVVERQFKKNRRVHYFIDEESGDEKEAPSSWSAERCEEFAEKTGVALLTRIEPRIRWRVTSDKVVLHDKWSPYKRFTIVPFFPYFRRGRSVGLMRNLISPQELVNKVTSQELHVVNTTANSGYMVPANSLVNMTIEELEDRGAETGLVIEYNASVGAPQKIEPNNIPRGLDHIGTKAAGYIRDISGVQPAVDGSDHPDVSGKAIMAKSARALVQIEVPRANLQRTREILCRNMLELIQEFYTEERVFLLINESQTRKPEDPETEEVAINKQVAGQVINDVTVGKYQMVVGSRPSADSHNDAQYTEALAMRGMGVAIPDDAIVMYSTLSDKTKLADRIRSATGQNPPSPEEQEAMQLIQQFKIENIKLQLMRLKAEIRQLETSSALNEVQALEKMQALSQEMSKLQMQLMHDSVGLQEKHDHELELELMSNATKKAVANIQASAQLKAARSRSSNLSTR